MDRTGTNNTPSNAAPDSQIIRVHGTFAGFKYEKSPEDAENAWYNRSSDFCKRLRQRLNDDRYVFATDFHWDGKNLSSSRSDAAKELLHLMIRFEEMGKPYHIVAHSHGGTVVWKALMMAERSKWRRKLSLSRWGSAETTLKNLRSWTTLGTPFIRNRIRLGREFLALVLQVLVLGSLGFAAFFGLHHFGVFESSGEGAGFAETAILILLIAVVAGLVLQFIKGISYHVMEAMRPDSRYLESLKKWVGIVSPDDEAVRGLEVASNLESDFVSSSSNFDSQFLSPFFLWLRVAIFSVFTVTRRFLLIPATNRFIRAQLRSFALGDNDRFQSSRGVSTSPTPSMKTPNLPEELVRSLRKSADLALKEMIPKLRETLATGVTAAGSKSQDIDFKVAASVMTGRELVHTSYYDNEDVVGLVADHIRMSEHVGCTSKRSHEWLTRFRETMADSPQTSWIDRIPLIVASTATVAIAAFALFLLEPRLDDLELILDEMISRIAKLGGKPEEK